MAKRAVGELAFERAHIGEPGELLERQPEPAREAAHGAQRRHFPTPRARPRGTHARRRWRFDDGERGLARGLVETRIVEKEADDAEAARPAQFAELRDESAREPRHPAALFAAALRPARGDVDGFKRTRECGVGERVGEGLAIHSEKKQKAGGRANASSGARAGLRRVAVTLARRDEWLTIFPGVTPERQRRTEVRRLPCLARTPVAADETRAPLRRQSPTRRGMGMSFRRISC